MAYRKFTADNIFTGSHMLNDDQVLITDEAGKVMDVLRTEEAGEGVEKLHGILCPGFINCHCHLELSHLKGLVAPGTGMVKFLLSIMANRGHSSETISEAITAAEQQMIDNGIVAVGDICNTADTIFIKREQRLYYHSFVEARGFDDRASAIRFAQAIEVYDQFPGPASIVPHAPYSVSDALFSLINRHRPGSLLTIHNQESDAENELFATGAGEFLDLYKAIGTDVSGNIAPGTTSLLSFLPKITRDHRMILVHNTVTSASDVAWLSANKHARPEIVWCLCPNANLYINNRLPAIPLLAGSGDKMVIGTDSLASNNQLNVLEEIKTIQQHFPAFSTPELLRWATLNGAEALGIDRSYGTFGTGKTPGVILIGNVKEGLLAGSFARKLL